MKKEARTLHPLSGSHLAAIEKFMPSTRNGKADDREKFNAAQPIQFMPENGRIEAMMPKLYNLGGLFSYGETIGEPYRLPETVLAGLQAFQTSRSRHNEDYPSSFLAA
jgi:hypothetical protein